MKFVLDIRHLLLFLFILLFYSNQVLSTSLPKISEPSEAIYNDLKIKYNCIPNGTLDLDFVMLEGGVKGQLKKYKENEWDSYYAIVPSIENKKINFNMSIKNYNPITVGSSGFVIDLVEASIKLASTYGHLVQSVNSCIPIIKDMFTYSKCIFTNENVNCSYESINGKVFFKCDATFDAECKIGKPIKQTSYDLIELKIKTKTEKYSCVVKFSSNEKELYLLSNKIKKLKNTEPLENCIQEDSLPTINIISNETTKNDNEITKIITSEETKITKNISTKSITVKTTTKIIQTNKSFSFIGDCINILFILLIIIFICSSIALGILIYLFRKKSQKSIKEIAEKGEKTVVVEDGQWEGNKKEENKSNKFMALKTVGMEADEGNMEDLGETGLTNIADDSDLSDGDEKVKKSKRDKEEDNNNKDSEVSKSRDGVEVPPEGVEVPETIQDTIVPNKVFGEDQPLYDTPL